MAKNPVTDVVMAAAQLKSAAPQQFTALVEAIRAHEKALIVDMVSSEQPTEIFRAQGGVKIMRQLRQNMQNCTELRAQYERREPNAR